MTLPELQVVLQLFPPLRRKARLFIDRFMQRFGAVRATRTLQPFPVERLVNQLKGVGGDGGFLFLAGE